MQFSHAIEYYEIYLGRRALGPDERPDEETGSYIEIDTNNVSGLLFRGSIIDDFYYAYLSLFSG